MRTTLFLFGLFLSVILCAAGCGKYNTKRFFCPPEGFDSAIVSVESEIHCTEAAAKKQLSRDIRDAIRRVCGEQYYSREACHHLCDGGPYDIHGDCVDCLEDTGECDSNAQLTFCKVNPDNVGNTCVQCGSDSDCQGNINGTVCDLETNACVQCTNSETHCGGSTAVCDPETNTCVQCTEDKDSVCTDNNRVCDPSDGTCVGCFETAQCSDNLDNKNVCDTDMEDRVCVACVTDTHCMGNANGTFCDPTENICRVCVAHTHCPDPEAAQCDPSTYTCTPCDPIAISENHCAGNTNGEVCELVSGTDPNICVQCTVQNGTTIGCTNPDKPVCNTNNTCIACLSPDDCNAPTPVCEIYTDTTMNTCAACTVQGTSTIGCDDDPNKPACAVSNDGNACVACTNTNPTLCTDNGQVCVNNTCV